MCFPKVEVALAPQWPAVTMVSDQKVKLLSCVSAAVLTVLEQSYFLWVLGS